MGHSYTPLLLRKKERDFLGLCLEFNDDILNQCEILDKQLDFFIKKDYQKASSIHGLLVNSGKSIRKSRKQIVFWVSENQVKPDSRSSLLRLVFAISQISTYIESASYRIQLKALDMDEELNRILLNISRLNLKCLKNLNDSLRLMNEDLEQVVGKTSEIAEFEDAVDDLRRMILKRIVNDERYSNAQDLYSITQILNSLETISDKVENSANILEILVMNYLP